MEEFTLHTSEGHLAHLGHVHQQTGGSQCQLGKRGVILIRVTTAHYLALCRPGGGKSGSIWNAGRVSYKEKVFFQ